MREMDDSERWIVGALLAVALLTFFFPLVSLQVPLAGTLGASGYDILSKAREFDQRLSALEERREAGSSSVPPNVTEEQASGDTGFSLPLSVQALPLLPIEIIISFACIGIATICCLSDAGPLPTKAFSTMGGAAGIVSLLHITIADSDLHTWFQQQIQAHSAGAGGDLFGNLVQGIETLAVNAVHLKPGSGLYVLAASATLAAVIAQSRVFSQHQSADLDTESDPDQGEGKGIAFFLLIVAVVVLVIGIALIHRAPAANHPISSSVQQSGQLRRPAPYVGDRNQGGSGPAMTPDTSAANSSESRLRLAEALTQVSAQQGHNHLYTVCRSDMLCITDAAAPGDGFVQSFGANRAIAERLFEAGFRRLFISNGTQEWGGYVTGAGFLPATDKNSFEREQPR